MAGILDMLRSLAGEPSREEAPPRRSRLSPFELGRMDARRPASLPTMPAPEWRIGAVVEVYDGLVHEHPSYTEADWLDYVRGFTHVAADEIGRPVRLVFVGHRGNGHYDYRIVSESYRYGYAFSPREGVKSQGRIHLVVREGFQFGRLVRSEGDALCKLRSAFWGLDVDRTFEDFQQYGCTRCRELARRLDEAGIRPFTEDVA